MHAIGIDIGGTSAKIGVILEGQVIRQERIPTGSELDYELFIEETGKRIRALCGEYPAEKAGISSCGLIDSGNGSILYSNNIRWEKKRLRRILCGERDWPCALPMTPNAPHWRRPSLGPERDTGECV